ncbi:homocysteine S-methyltransferase family protein [SAR202 cluster bacterium AD-802-E10_MRT_200m]|nr:homocysteine S-methyltransferase family protein [SAR202 cluster bacterium AD-802-E10_MRT_200m]
MNLADTLQNKLDTKKIVIMDGGTGTEISRRGVTLYPSLSWSANANVTHPELVRDIHRDYILAGAEIIITNTFSTSRATLANDGLSSQTEEINNESVRLAMEARKNCGADDRVVIAGSVSSFEPKGHPEIIPSYEAALEDYREQATILAASGVDLIVLEMFTRTVDLKAAIVAATETGLPIWVGLSCESHDGQIYLGLMGRHGGETIADAVLTSSSPNVKAFCIMHSPPEVTAQALQELKNSTSLPLGAYAHGGNIEGGNSLGASADPQKYLDYAHEWVACGATIVGGCCGTTPEHIRVLTGSNLRDKNI